MKAEWSCNNCEHYECQSRRCLHRCGPYMTCPENPGCRYFELNEQGKRMNKYGDMSIDNMIEKMEELEKNLALSQRVNCDLSHRANRLDDENSSLKKRNEALDKRAEALVKAVEEKDEQIEKLKKDNDFFRNSICNEADLRIRNANLSKLVTEKNQQLADKDVIIKDLNAHNDELLKDFGEAAKEVEERRTLIMKLQNENREKEAKIASLTQELADCRNHRWGKDSYTKELEDQLDRSSDVVSEQELKIEDLQKKLDSLIERNKALKWVLRELYPETFVTRYLGRPMGYDDGTSKICYKCCPEIKKLIDDAKERLEHDERVFRSTETFNLDVSSLYPKKFDLNPNADCPAYAARMKAKYDCLRKVGFTEDQTMSLLPLWTDE